MNAVIEIGTNSLKLLIYKDQPNFQVVYDKTSISRLGEDYHKTGKISYPALDRNIEEINSCLKICNDYACRHVSLYGTMIFRAAENSQEVLTKIYQKTKLKLQILSGEEEAKYSFLAATSSLSLADKRLLVVDTGGGSTEFISGSMSQINYQTSLELGAVILTDLFSLDKRVNLETLTRAKNYINKQLASLPNFPHPELIVGIGGTVTSISAIVQKLQVYSAQKVQASTITSRQVTELIAQLACKNFQERQSIIGLSAKRADIILGGVLIINSILDKFQKNDILVCDNGLRYGLALKEGRKK
jgi:exopolyphosphatase/guanosine-5'-triphosphate,3'-diphosphate pyrophosphatase